MEKYTLSKPDPEKLKHFKIVIIADANDADYLTSVSSYTKEEFDECFADQVIKLLRDYNGPHGLEKIDYKSGIDLDIPYDLDGEMCHTLESLEVTYVDENGCFHDVVFNINQE